MDAKEEKEIEKPITLDVTMKDKIKEIVDTLIARGYIKMTDTNSDIVKLLELVKEKLEKTRR